MPKHDGYWGAMEQKTRLRIQATTLAADSGEMQISGGESFLCIAFGTGLLVLGATFGRDKKTHSPRPSATSRSHTTSKL